MKRNICLIAPPRYEKEVDAFLPQNLGLGYIAANLEKAGNVVTIIDALALGWERRRRIKENGLFLRGLSIDEILKRLPNDVEFVGIAGQFITSKKVVIYIASLIKNKFPKVLTVIGGISPSINPFDFIDDVSVDFVVQGPGEIAMVELVSGKCLSEIKGLVFKNKEGVSDNIQGEIPDDLDSLPFPARYLLPMEKYLALSGRGRSDLRTASLLTSRGCPFDCTFCSVHHIFGYKWRSRSPKNIIEEIQMLIDEYDVQHIEFEDDNLTLNARRAEEIFDGIANLEKKITWSTPNGIRIDTLSKDLLIKMKKSGCSSLSLSIESGDPEILKIMNKQLDLKKVEEVVRICGDLSINTNGIFIVGYLGETAKSFEKTIKYIKRLRKIGLIGVSASIAKAYPGTKLRRMCEENNSLVDKERYSCCKAIGEYVDIKTSYFTEREIFERLYYIRKKLNPIRYYSDLFFITKIIKIILPQWFIDLIKKRIYLLFKT